MSQKKILPNAANKPLSWIRTHRNGILLLTYIQPQAKETAIVGLFGEPKRLKIKVAAPPSEGKANLALISFLCKKINLPKGAIQILSGDKSRQKNVLLITKHSLEEIQNALRI